MTEEKMDWPGVTAKAAALVALHQVGLKDETLLRKSEFLEKLGIPRGEVAKMLGTTADSISAQWRARKRGSRGKGK